MCSGGDLRGVQRLRPGQPPPPASAGWSSRRAAAPPTWRRPPPRWRTDGLDLSTGVAVAFPRSPMVTAQTAWELAALTGGRFRLGPRHPGARSTPSAATASPFDPPGPRLREYVLAVKAIFRAFRGEEKLAFDGEFSKLLVHAGGVVTGADRASPTRRSTSPR